uniref:Cytochrome P450 4V2 n=3 Tax=Culex pipiens TaxID=7175 RepID=A0A8D8K6R6_CULPI
MAGEIDGRSWLMIIETLAGEKWRYLRRILNPTFNTRMLNNFIPIMDSRTRRMVSRMATLADGRTDVDLLEYIGVCSLEIVFCTTMGRNADELRGKPEYMECIKVVMEMVGRRIMNANYMVNALYRLTGAYKVEQKAREVLKRFTKQIIYSRREELDKEQNVTVKDDEFHRRSLNFLDQILMIRKDDGTGFTDQEVYYHLETIISAASDTTALTVANTLLFLAMHPNIQEKVVTELNEVFFSEAIELNQDTLGQLRYTEQVIKESLRLCPSAPVEARQTSCEITMDGVRIPKDQILVANFYTLHRRPDFWGPDPERFDPDRFTPEAIEQRHPYAYLPFSGGLRNCIGSRHAMHTSKIMLTRILQNFEVRTDMKQSDMRFKFEITLKLVGPHRVRLVRRGLKL